MIELDNTNTDDEKMVLMSIGYACLTVGVPFTDMKNCVLKNASDARLSELIAHNLNSLENIIDYNIKNNINLFRISSDIIPFASNPANKLSWWSLYENRFAAIGKKIQNSRMRISMHPGQYTVLNSPDADVVKRAIEDLNYHEKVLSSLGANSQNKIILHIGGVYGDKKQAIIRFADNFNLLDNAVKQRLVIENDDKCYNISDVLGIANNLNLPAVFDNLHNALNPSGMDESDLYWINLCSKTWEVQDGRQKIHYSQKNPIKKSGSHSESIQINEFLGFYDSIGRKDIDIMLEVKNKNLSAIKCANCITNEKRINRLELEWSRYKYLILEKSHQDYNRIRILLKDKSAYPAMDFYNIIENVMSKDSEKGDAVNAAMHVWGYFKEKATEKEKALFLHKTDAFLQGNASLTNIKNNLWNLAVKYEEHYLLESYYFAY